MNFFNSRKFRQGSMATIITALVITLIVIINLVATALSNRYSLMLDLTPNKAFSLTQDSIDLLAGINKDVNVYILSREEDFTAANEYFAQANEVIKRYSQYSRHITIEYVDIIRDPTFATRYPSLTLSAGYILLDCEGRTAVLTPYNLFDISTDYYGDTVLTASNAEREMSTALLNVTSDKKIKVSLLLGHMEADITAFLNLLTMNGCEIIYQNLMTDLEIDPSATIAILPAPARDISEDEARKLDRFLENNGETSGRTLFYLGGSSQPKDLPVLEAFLSEWGIGVKSGVVFELDQSMLFYLDHFATMPLYMEDTYSATVLARQLPMGVPAARPLEKLFDTKLYMTVTELLTFSYSAGVMPHETSTDWTPANEGASGPIPALLLSSDVRSATNGELIKSHVLVGGSVDMIGDYLLGDVNFANSDYILNLLNTLAERDTKVVIQNKTLGGQSLGISVSQIVVISVGLAIVFPLLVLISGIVIWMRRRHS